MKFIFYLIFLSLYNGNKVLDFYEQTKKDFEFSKLDTKKGPSLTYSETANYEKPIYKKRYEQFTSPTQLDEMFAKSKLHKKSKEY